MNFSEPALQGNWANLRKVQETAVDDTPGNRIDRLAAEMVQKNLLPKNIIQNTVGFGQYLISSSKLKNKTEFFDPSHLVVLLFRSVMSFH